MGGFLACGLYDSRFRVGDSLGEQIKKKGNRAGGGGGLFVGVEGSALRV